MQMYILSMPGVSEIAACPPSSIADDASTLLSPTSSPCSSQHLFYPLHSMPQSLHAGSCTVLLYFSKYCKIKMFFSFCVFVFMYYVCEKYYKRLAVQYCVGSFVSWVPRLTLWDLGTNWTYECTLGMGLVYMQGTHCNVRCMKCPE